MATRPKRVTSKRTGEEGWIIDASARVPKSVRYRFQEKKQLRKHQFVSLSKCPEVTDAKELKITWEKELKDKIKGSLKPEITFDDCYKHYCENHNPSRTLMWVNSHIGSWLIDDDFIFKFKAWIDSERHRKKFIHKKVDKTLVWLPGTTNPSPRHIINEIAAAKSVLYNMGQHPIKLYRLKENPLEELLPDKKKARKRKIRDYEELWLMYVIKKFYSWFLPAVLFAKTNPIRPQDQFSLTISKHLTWDEINKQWRLAYIPQKTEHQVQDKIIARPVVWDDQKEYFENLHSSERCDRIFVRPGWPQCHEDPFKLYPINYRKIWETIRKKAEALAKENCKSIIDRENIHMTDIQWYDWRHHAVRFLKMKGLSTDDIMQIAGWATETMVREYDPGEDDPDVRILEKMRRLNKIFGESPAEAA
jgi:hypothetical protein